MRGSALLLALAGALVFGGQADACTRWASDRGAEANPGTAEAPFRNVQMLVDSLSPGEVGCLAPGSIFAEAVVIRRPGIQLRTGPGRRATIRGAVRVVPGADNVTLSSLLLEGADVGHEGTVQVEANGVRIVGNDISGPFLANRNVHCVLLSGASGTLVDGNVIHRCTRGSLQTVYSAGVVVASASATTIRNNFISEALGDGIALAPNAVGSFVHNNVIDGNRGGVYFGGSSESASRDNRVVANIISYSGRYNVHASYLPGAPVGQNNIVSGNCLWRGGRGNLAGSGAGFQAANNLVARPGFVNRAAGFALRPGPCFLNRPLPRAGGRYAFLPRFVVRYRLRALPGSVQVVRLVVVNLRAGARLDVRCVRRCRGGERVVAGRRGVATSQLVRGRWLPRGAVIELRTRKPWWVGHFARVVVTGLPKGVTVQHACLPPAGTPTPVECRRYR